jgi:hypothetical protein
MPDPEITAGDERIVKLRGGVVRVSPLSGRRVRIDGALPDTLTADEAVDLGDALRDAGRIAALGQALRKGGPES